MSIIKFILSYIGMYLIASPYAYELNDLNQMIILLGIMILSLSFSIRK